MEYKKVSAFWVFDEIEKGKEVFVLDRSTRAVESVNDMTVGRAVGLVEDAKESKNDRYEFWYAEFAEKEVKDA